jgi:hypothetical protein
MTIIPHGENGQPLEPTPHLRPTLFDGTNLWLFDSMEEYDAWYKEHFTQEAENQNNNELTN